MQKNPPQQICVQNPCQQSWSAMRPETQGRFCGACSQIVIDFSAYTDQELIEFFAQDRIDRVCGRFRAEQLDRPLMPVRSYGSWFRSLAALLFPFFLSSRADAQRIDSIHSVRKQVADTTQVNRVSRVMGMPMPNIRKPVKVVPIQKVNTNENDPRVVKGKPKINR